MNSRTESGEIYFDLNNDPEGQELLNDFFVGLGFTVVDRKGLEDNLYFKRVTVFRDDHGLQFSVIWFKNISTIRFGEWGKSFIDISFEKIKCALTSNNDHLTLGFMVDGKQKGCMSIYKKR